VTGEGFYPVSSGQTTPATVTDEYIPGCLEVSKNVILNNVIDEGGTLPTSFDFTVTGPSFATPYSFTLADGQTETICGLIPGDYEVSEDKTGLSAAWKVTGEGFYPVSSGQTTAAWKVTGEGFYPVSSGQTTPATVTDEYIPGCLEVSKNVINVPTDVDTTFTITVTGPSYQSGTSMAFSLSGGVVTPSIWALENLITGEYTVDEVNPGNLWSVSGTGTATVYPGETCATKTVTNTYMVFRKEFANPMVKVDDAWMPLDLWHEANGTSGAQWFPLNEQIKWTVGFYVPNASGETWTDVVLRDRFGAELDLYGTTYKLNGVEHDIEFPIGVGNLNKNVPVDTYGVGFQYAKAKQMPQFRVYWEIGDIPDGGIAILTFEVGTRLNPGQNKKAEPKWEFTSCGIHVLNSGANLKWIDAFDVQNSESTEGWAIQVCMPTPTVTTDLSSDSIYDGETVTDTAYVSDLEGIHGIDGAPYPMPTGSIDFEVSTDGGFTWGPYDVKALTDGSAISGSYQPPAVGTYYFRAVFSSADSNYNGSQSGNWDEELTVELPPG
jgi:hypothetical protein